MVFIAKYLWVLIAVELGAGEANNITRCRRAGLLRVCLIIGNSTHLRQKESPSDSLQF